MKSRKEQHREEKHNSIGLSVMLMLISGAAAIMNGNAAVCHELTAFGLCYTLLPLLLFLGALAWSLHLTRRNRHCGSLYLRKSKHH